MHGSAQAAARGADAIICLQASQDIDDQGAYFFPLAGTHVNPPFLFDKWLCGTPRAARWSAISDATVQGGLPGRSSPPQCHQSRSSPMINPEVPPNGQIVGTWFADHISVRHRRVATRLRWKKDEESNDV